MESDKTFLIVEFSDGLQIIPAKWLTSTKESCIWPSHFKKQLRLNKAIMTGEMPKEQWEWEVFPIKRIFGGAGTYKKSMKKLMLALDTSNVDDTGMSSSEIKERRKKRRRIKARRKNTSSSSEEEEEDQLVMNKENNPIQNKKLPNFPQIEKFLSSCTPLTETSSQHIANTMHDDTFNSSLSKKDVMGSCTQNKKERVVAANVYNVKEDSSAHEFRRQVLLKLNKILYKMDTYENMLYTFEEKLQLKYNEIDEKHDIQFPLVSLEDLNNFEEQLQNSQFKQKVLNILKLIGGNSMRSMINNVLKKIMANTLAVKYGWAGMKGKLIFKELVLTKVIMQTIRLHLQYSQTTDAELAESISKWLAQAPLRTQREMKRTQTIENESLININEQEGSNNSQLERNFNPEKEEKGKAPKKRDLESRSQKERRDNKETNNKSDSTTSEYSV